jgi:hypothetical protein
MIQYEANNHAKALLRPHLTARPFTQGVNEWNAFFYFMSAFTLPTLYFWVYHVISVRLREYHAAIVSGSCLYIVE